MANVKKAAAEKVSEPAADLKSVSAPVKNTANKTPAVKKADKKPAGKAAGKPVAKETAKTVKAAAEPKPAGRRVSKVKKLTMNDVVAQAKVKANAANTTKVTKKIAATFSLDGSVNGDFYILLESGKVSVEPYKYDDADLWIKGSADVINDIMNNKLKFIDAVSSGKADIWGNAEKAVIFVDAVL